jgi:hypothetical protein
MEFKEAYKKGLKTGKTIRNGEYNLRLETTENFGNKYLKVISTCIKNDKDFYFDINKLFFDSLEDNWEIIRED